jgi:dTMP kinase
LVSRSISYTLTQEPGGTPLGLMMRRVLLSMPDGSLSAEAELFLYLADRAQHVAKHIRPALDEGLVVICDRYDDSTTAYQGYGRGLDLELICKINNLATGGLKPHLTLLLDLPVEEGLARIGRRGAQSGGEKDRMERETLEFHRRVREGFLDIAAKDPDRVKVLDATLPIDQLALLIQKIVEPYLEMVSQPNRKNMN